MKKNRNRLIMGSAIGLAAIAVAIDHTKHRLPVPLEQQAAVSEDVSDDSPCSLGGYGQQSYDEAPCSLGGYGDSPCGLGSFSQDD